MEAAGSDSFCFALVDIMDVFSFSHCLLQGRLLLLDPEVLVV